VRIEIRQTPFDPWQETAAYQQCITAGKSGAAAVFVGTMRDFNEGEAVQAMTLEHYPGMTEKHIREICEQAEKQWRLLDCLVLHRVGEIQLGEAIVLIAVWAEHRGDAMDACRFVIEDLKTRAPFWKKERLANQERWVESNTTGYSVSEEPGVRGEESGKSRR
jgi:molybdopterin synthase catalytic subunit